MLAERFARDEGGVSTVIIASGESQVDAVTASGLAGNRNAPVLLTRSSRLPHNVARFIDEHNVGDVIIVGGTAAVSDAVETAILSLGSRPEVHRIGETDRYATAAAIGSELGGPNPTWCGSTQTAAILVNGGDAGRADAVIAGPLAFRLGLPVLLTAADELPDATADFLTDEKVERVVIVGGTAAVSAEVEDALVEDVGVVNTQRIDGGSAAATSAMVAKEMLGNCAEVLQTNRDMVALVNRDAIADGIAAAPVLGRGLGAAGSVPILLVSDELPAAVNDYLASTPNVNAAGNKTHLSIVAIGGRAVVSDSVMADAVAAAKTSSMLTATITPIKYTASTLAQARDTTLTGNDAHPCRNSAGLAAAVVGSYSCSFQVTFSDDVKEPVDGNTDDAFDAVERRGTVLDPTMYRYEGRRLQAYVATSPDEIGTVRDLVFTANRTVTISLSVHLTAGHEITVDNSLNEKANGRLGKNNDLRKLERASLTLPALSLPKDNAAPVVEIIAVEGQSLVDVIIHEPNVNDASNDLASATPAILGRVISVKGVPLPAVTGTSVATPRVVTLRRTDPQPTEFPGRKGTDKHRIRYTVDVTAGPVATGSTPGAPEAELLANDVITVARNAVRDKGGRGNALTQARVRRAKTNTVPPADPTGNGYLEIESVSIGDYYHGLQSQQASVIFGTGTAALKVTAKADGVAAGAAGNSWIIFGYDDRAASTIDTIAFDISVAVDTANQRISYTISDAVPQRPYRPARISDLAGEMVRNDDFLANFIVSYGGTGQTKLSSLGTPAAAGERFGDGDTGEVTGRTSVGVVVKFNAAVHTLAGTAPGTDHLAYDIAPSFDTGTLTAPDALAVTFFLPDNQVHISYTAHDMVHLPKRDGFRVIAADRAHGYNAAETSGTAHTGGGQGNLREILHNLRPDSSIRP